jgi:hypothetical protein
LALLLIVVGRVFYLNGHQSANKRYEAEKAAQDATQKHQNDCLEGEVFTFNLKECFRSTIRPTREEERAEQDLNAQREMANWAEGMLWASLVSVIVTVVGVFYVALTLRETRKAATEAASAYAVDRRAYVILTPPDIVTPPCSIWPEVPALTCTVKNAGRGPATIVSICRKWEARPANNWPAPISDNKYTVAISMPVGPNGETPPIFSRTDQIRCPINCDDWIFFLGYVEFIEENGEKYRSGFCYVARPDIKGIGFHVAFIPNKEKYWYQEKL